ncbi:uncharacterized protein LOC117533700 isoform X2 [Gymnodraco acuticeps]|uniref:Uncharacterized protein LOC117533700 isoform X2 n=1 Tax=Gymnodraco acuticeps TaxID=8218 RepID=A0A6P8SSZ0_GYMAC|nr:uncharacterized protein LOC117533700 isoform X2 [Gymnodraco acuticeps]
MPAAEPWEHTTGIAGRRLGQAVRGHSKLRWWGSAPAIKPGHVGQSRGSRSVHDEWPLTVVHYHCNPNQSFSTVREQSLGAEGPLQIWVESPCACPNTCAMGDLGLGTIFLIILSISAAAYFILVHRGTPCSLLHGVHLQSPTPDPAAAS